MLNANELPMDIEGLLNKKEEMVAQIKLWNEKYPGTTWAEMLLRDANRPYSRLDFLIIDNACVRAGHCDGNKKI